MDRKELVSRFRLSECVECRSCSDSCPSHRNGGIDPQQTISEILNGIETKNVWMCMVCHRCSAVCPKNIDVAGMMISLREMSAKDGNVPDVIRRSYASILSDGRISMPRGRTELLRKELGLPDVVKDQKIIDELEEIMKGDGNE